MKKIVPKFDRVVVIPMEDDYQSLGIALPETSAEEQKLGVVVMAGKRCLDTKTGDIVLFGIYAGLEIEINDKMFIVMREEEIIGTVVESDEADS